MKTTGKPAIDAVCHAVTHAHADLLNSFDDQEPASPRVVLAGYG